MGRRLLVLLLLCLPAASFSGDEVHAIWARFDHTEHTKAFARNDVSCVGCHQVGLPGDALAPPPEQACHQCHVDNPERGLIHRTPTRCETCHDQVKRPDSHGPAWLAWHGSERDATCSDCHVRRDCVDCHERRQEPDRRVHEPSFLTTHGIEAAAGATCDSCHSQNECVSCHGGAP